MNEKTRRDTEPRVQYAALPYRLRADGTVEILLITSRETRRWVVPKGWPMKSREPHAAAAREALEEAGVIGRVTREPIGSYRYDKRLKNGELVPCLVELFPLEVKSQRKRWPEKGQRTLRWLPAAEAAEVVDEAELGEAIRDFGTHLLAAGPAGG